MTALTDMTEFIAKQLNDHESSPRGLAQPTYYTWTEHHIKQALGLAAAYVYSLKPDLFASLACHQTTVAGCTVDLSGVCGNVLRITGVGSDCDNVVERPAESKSLLGMLSTSCTVPTPNDGSAERYTFETLAEGIVQFKEQLPVGTPIYYLCAGYDGIDNVSDSILAEYGPMLIAFALWWLLLTDNESRSNPDRWAAYYGQVQDFVTRKMQMEFSLRATDYQDGTQLTPRSTLDA